MRGRPWLALPLILLTLAGCVGPSATAACDPEEAAALEASWKTVFATMENLWNGSFLWEVEGVFQGVPFEAKLRLDVDRERMRVAVAGHDLRIDGIDEWSAFNGTWTWLRNHAPRNVTGELLEEMAKVGVGSFLGFWEASDRPDRRDNLGLRVLGLESHGQRQGMQRTIFGQAVLHPSWLFPRNATLACEAGNVVATHVGDITHTVHLSEGEVNTWQTVFPNGDHIHRKLSTLPDLGVPHGTREPAYWGVTVWSSAPCRPQEGDTFTYATFETVPAADILWRVVEEGMPVEDILWWRPFEAGATVATDGGYVEMTYAEDDRPWATEVLISPVPGYRLVFRDTWAEASVVAPSTLQSWMHLSDDHPACS